MVCLPYRKENLQIHYTTCYAPVFLKNRLTAIAGIKNNIMKTTLEDVYNELPTGIQEEFLYVMTNFKEIIQEVKRRNYSINDKHPERIIRNESLLIKLEKELDFFKTKRDKKPKH